MKNQKALNDWLEKHGAEGRRILAKKAGTSVNYLSHIAAPAGASYARKVSADMAARLEVASGGELKRDQLCETCAQCPYAKAARK